MLGVVIVLFPFQFGLRVTDPRSARHEPLPTRATSGREKIRKNRDRWRGQERMRQHGGYLLFLILRGTRPPPITDLKVGAIRGVPVEGGVGKHNLDCGWSRGKAFPYHKPDSI